MVEELKIRYVDGGWYTQDDQGEQHSYDGKPSYHKPSEGYEEWQDHGRWHRLDGNSYTDKRQHRKDWEVCGYNLWGRLLLW